MDGTAPRFCKNFPPTRQPRPRKKCENFWRRGSDTAARTGARCHLGLWSVAPVTLLLETHNGHPDERRCAVERCSRTSHFTTEETGGPGHRAQRQAATYKSQRTQHLSRVGTQLRSFDCLMLNAASVQALANGQWGTRFTISGSTFFPTMENICFWMSTAPSILK